MADKGKALYEKHQRILADLLREEENKTCADCGGRGPRWASWNLGVFLCIRCAGIHRNLGVHVSRVKSVNLDSWTPDQISSIQKGGNRKAQLTYEATLPSDYKRPVDDYSVEQFIRNKYIKKSWASKDPVNGEGKKAVNKQTSPVKNDVKTKPQQEVKKPSQVKNTLPKPSNPHIGRSTSAPLKPVQPPPVVDLLSDDITLPTTIQQTPDRSKTFSFADQKSSHSANHLNTIQDSDSFFGVPKPASSQPEPMGKDAILSLYSRNQQQGYNGMGYHPMYACHQQQMAMVQAQHQMYYAQQQSQISQVQEKMARLKMRQQQETASANGSGTLNPHLW